MALDPEELKKQRLQKKQAREKKRRQTIAKLIIGASILLVSAIVIISVASKTEKPEKVTSPEQTEETAPNTTVVHLSAVGDLNVTQRVVDAGGGEYDYTKLLLDVAPVLAQADITTVNFEGCLFGEPYGADRSAPQGLANALSNAGVDLVQLANSYSIYKGMDGLVSTINSIRSAGMEPLGVYENAAAAQKAKGYTLRNVKGVKIAFVAFTKGMDGMALPAGNDGCVNLLYSDYSSDYQTINTDGINKILNDVKKEKPDITVALLHWGSEFNDTVSTSQKEICTLLQQGGVDAIIGTHSHYIQPMEFDAENGSFTAYSLGDFLGDAERAGSEYSIVLDLEITKDLDSGKAKITGFDYTPIFICNEKNSPLRVLRIQEAMTAYESGYIDRVSESTYNAMLYALERIEKRVAGE